MELILLGNWTQSTNWAAIKAEQRNEDGSRITEGKDFGVKTREFSLLQYIPEGDLFPERSRIGALASAVLYGPTVILHTYVTAAGNMGKTIINVALACRDLYSKRKEEGFSVLKTLTPAGKQLVGTLKNVVVIGALEAARRYQISILGYSSYAIAVGAGLTLWTLYSAYNPLGAMYSVSRAEKMLHVKPLTDGQVSQLSWPKTFLHMLDGSYSLSRLFNIHRVGNISDKVEDDKKFEKVESKKN